MPSRFGGLIDDLITGGRRFAFEQLISTPNKSIDSATKAWYVDPAKCDIDDTTFCTLLIQ